MTATGTTSACTPQLTGKTLGVIVDTLSLTFTTVGRGPRHRLRVTPSRPRRLPQLVDASQLLLPPERDLRSPRDRRHSPDLHH